MAFLIVPGGLPYAINVNTRNVHAMSMRFSGQKQATKGADIACFVCDFTFTKYEGGLRPSYYPPGNYIHLHLTMLKYARHVYLAEGKWRGARR